MSSDIQAVADRLLAAYDAAELLEPITAGDADFDVDDAYEVLRRIEARRHEQGWAPRGRKIGFTNTQIWELFNVSGPFWARMWDRTVLWNRDTTSFPLAPLVQPRIEPEVVFGLAAAPPQTDDPEALLGAVEWMAAGFEIVQCWFQDWRFSAADCTAAFGLHGALVIGTPVPVGDADRAALATTLTAFEVTLSRDGDVVDTGSGANVLGSPALALGYLVRTIAGQPAADPLAGGEIITTGTVTNAWPVQRGERWEATYGDLGVEPVHITFA